MKTLTLKNKLHITVAIPALNEEKNIGALLTSVLEQSGSQFVVDKVQVVSDGSTDKTVSIAQSFGKKVSVVANSSRLGKAHRINQVFAKFTGDVLVLLDADQKLDGPAVFSKLIEPFLKEKKLGLVCSYVTPLPPTSFVSTLAVFGFKVWDRARSGLRKHAERYYCDGALLALSADLVETLRYPEKVAVDDDSYTYFYAKSHGFEVAVAKQARAYMQLPTTFADYTSQMKRFLAAPDLTEKYFGKEIQQKYELMDMKTRMMAWATESARTPFIAVSYLALQAWTHLQMRGYTAQVTWKVARSTKA